MPIYRNNQLRKGRYSEPGRIYILTTVVKNRAPVFADFKLGRCLVRELINTQLWNQAQSLAWVIMPDHLHWLVQLQDAPLATLANQIKSRSARAINRQRGCLGPMWQSGFHDRALRRDEDLAAAARYIVANPIRAGLVQRVGDYPLWDAVWV